MKATGREDRREVPLWVSRSLVLHNVSINSLGM